MSEFDHLVMKAREAMAGNINVLSTGEALAAALVLNRFDWLSEMGYTITEALDRIGPGWVGMPIGAALPPGRLAANPIGWSPSRYSVV